MEEGRWRREDGGVGNTAEDVNPPNSGMTDWFN